MTEYHTWLYICVVCSRCIYSEMVTVLWGWAGLHIDLQGEATTPHTIPHFTLAILLSPSSVTHLLFSFNHSLSAFRLHSLQSREYTLAFHYKHIHTRIGTIIISQEKTFYTLVVSIRLSPFSVISYS